MYNSFTLENIHYIMHLYNNTTNCIIHNAKSVRTVSHYVYVIVVHIYTLYSQHIKRISHYRSIIKHIIIIYYFYQRFYIGTCKQATVNYMATIRINFIALRVLVISAYNSLHLHAGHYFSEKSNHPLEYIRFILYVLYFGGAH